MTSVNPWPARWRAMCSITGRLQTETIGLGMSYVIGRNRVPSPAARIIALTERGSGALIPARQVLVLSVAELVDLDPLRLELEAGDLVVDLARHDVNLGLQRIVVLRHVLG